MCTARPAEPKHQLSSLTFDPLEKFSTFCDHRSRHEGFIAVGCNLSAVVTRTGVIARLDDKCALQGQRSQKRSSTTWRDPKTWSMHAHMLALDSAGVFTD